MHTTGYNPQISDLRELAMAVVRDAHERPMMTARTAARCLSGIANLVAHRFSMGQMQRACGELARYAPAWASQLGNLPTDERGYVPEETQLIAVVARGILPMAGVANMRAALAFWASERDPAVWTSVIGG